MEVLQKLHLKTIVKEAHGSAVRQLLFHSLDADKAHLFASVAHNQARSRLRPPQRQGLSRLQATVYDNEHFGSFVAVVAQFTNTATEHSPGGVRRRRLGDASRLLRR